MERSDVGACAFFIMKRSNGTYFVEYITLNLKEKKEKEGKGNKRKKEKDEK